MVDRALGCLRGQPSRNPYVHRAYARERRFPWLLPLLDVRPCADPEPAGGPRILAPGGRRRHAAVLYHEPVLRPAARQPRQLAAGDGDVEQLLTGLAYATDVDTVFSEFDAGQGEELGYWAGRYSLFDSAGNRFDLVVGRDSATLTVPPALVDVAALPAGTDLATVTVLSSTGFSQGVLQLANTQCQGTLRFTLPVSDASFDTAEPAALFEATVPQCQGTIAVGGGAARPVQGKRGAWTQAGVAQVADGDPAAAWYGQYVLLDVTDVTAVVQVPEPVFIYDDPTYGLTFQWGASRYGRNVTYSNNVLQCADQDDDTTQYVMQFVAPQVGGAELNLAVSRAGVVRAYRGYWVASAPPPSLGARRRRGRCRPGCGGAPRPPSATARAASARRSTCTV